MKGDTNKTTIYDEPVFDLALTDDIIETRRTSDNPSHPVYCTCEVAHFDYVRLYVATSDYSVRRWDSINGDSYLREPTLEEIGEVIKAQN